MRLQSLPCFRHQTKIFRMIGMLLFFFNKIHAALSSQKIETRHTSATAVAFVLLLYSKCRPWESAMRSSEEHQCLQKPTNIGSWVTGRETARSSLLWFSKDLSSEMKSRWKCGHARPGLYIVRLPHESLSSGAPTGEELGTLESVKAKLSFFLFKYQAIKV
jgi:hypothetical protein